MKLLLGRAEVPYQGRPLPLTQGPMNAQKILLKKRTWYQARRHVCAKARLRNPDQNGTILDHLGLANAKIWLGSTEIRGAPKFGVPQMGVEEMGV